MLSSRSSLVGPPELPAPLMATASTAADLLQFNELQAEMDKFLNKFEHWIAAKKDHIAKCHSEHRLRLLALSASIDGVREQIEQCHRQDDECRQRQAKDEQALAESQHAAEEVHIQLDTVRDVEQKLAAEVKQHRSLLGKHESRRAAKERELTERQQVHQPQIDFFERHLGLRMVGERDQSMRFVFTRIDPRQPDREYSFVMGVGGAQYEVTECQPPLSGMPKLVKQLNEDRDFYGFIKRVRQELSA